MKFRIDMKTIKGVLLGTVLGGIIFGGLGVAAITLTAKDIKYTPSNENFTVTNAKEAIDELYKISEDKISNVHYPFKVEGFFNNTNSNHNVDTGGIILYYMVNDYTKYDFSDITDGTWLELFEISGYKDGVSTTLSSGRNGFHGSPYPDVIDITGYDYISVKLFKYGSTVNSSGKYTTDVVDLTKMKFLK